MRDPFMVDPEEHKNLKIGGGDGGGIPCPKMNSGGKCYVCDKVRELFKTQKKEDRDIAYDKMAKTSFFLNGILSKDPSTLRLMELGKTVGNDILDGIETKGWTDIAHPKSDKGREMMITKKTGNNKQNTYTISPKLQHADWEVSDEVLDNLHNLDNITSLILDPDLSIFRFAREMKLDETVTFRILPFWGWKDKNDKRTQVLKPLFRHWGASQGEIDGTTSINWKRVVQKDDTKSFIADESPNSNTPTCFGDSRFFDADDDDCTKCGVFKKCGKAVATKKED